MLSAAASRLFHALLIELVSEDYAPEARFLSHRRIMRHWKVATPTANEALRQLREQGILRVKERSGHYLAPDFRQRALLLLDRETQSEQAPLRRADLRSRIMASDDEGGLRRIALVLILGGQRPVSRLRTPAPPAEYDRGSALTVHGIFTEAKNAGCLVDFHLHNGGRESEELMLSRLLATRPGGVIFVRRLQGYDLTRMARALLARLTPVVTVYNERAYAGVVSVNFNNVGMGYHAADSFLQKGHARLGIFFPPKQGMNDRDRVQGFRTRVAEAGLEVRDFVVDENAASLDDTVDAVLASGVTAIFSTGHEMLQAMVRVPRFNERVQSGGISVASCSSLNNLDGLAQPVDVMFMDFESLGRAAFELLKSCHQGGAHPKSYLSHSLSQSGISVSRTPPGPDAP